MSAAGRRCGVIVGLKPMGGMVLVQVVFAVVNILYKLAMNDGMGVRVLVAYRYLFASASLAPVAFFLERKERPRLTWIVLAYAFFNGLFGGSLVQNLYIASLNMTTVTFASAMTNLVPALTFVLAVLFRLETLRIRTASGMAKVTGTLVGLGGAMLLTFYKGPELNVWSTNVDLGKLSGGGAHASPTTVPSSSGNQVLGSSLAVASCVCYAVWLIIQAKIAQIYPCPYSTTTLMCFMAAVQSSIYALCIERNNWSAWHLGFDIRLLTVLFVGTFASGPILALIAWCVEKKGPLYASVFNPLMLVIVAILGSLLLQEKLHLGSVVGSVLIVIGLYFVIWGKGREVKKIMQETPIVVDPSFHEMSSRGSATLYDSIHVMMDRDFLSKTQAEEEEGVKEEEEKEDEGITILTVGG